MPKSCGLTAALETAEVQLAELLDRQSEDNLRASKIATEISSVDTADFPEAADPMHTWTVTHNRGERRMVTIEDNDDMTPLYIEESTRPTSLGTGWNGYVFTQERPGGVTRTVTVYTNIKDPVDEDFALAYGGLQRSEITDAASLERFLTDLNQQVNMDGTSSS